MKLNGEVEFIINSLEENGFEGFVVGGCVRDSLMGIEPHDYDITTNALPKDIKSIFKRTVDTGIKHGTVTVMLDKEGYEVTTYRVDGKYSDSRHPDSVDFTDDITLDLSRRDFTMNAIAYNSSRGYVDPFGGIEDIKAGIIRGVREPGMRFKEDALRMIRCLRFAAQLGFDIDSETYSAVKKNAELIKNVSIERVTAEFIKLITSPYAQKISLLRECGLMKYCAPQIDNALNERGKDIEQLLGKIAKDEIEAMAVIMADEENLESVLREMRLSNMQIKEITVLTEHYYDKIDLNEYGLRKLLSEIGRESVVRLFDIKKAMGQDNIEKAWEYLKDKKPFTKKELAVNGKDIALLGFKGEEIGKTINRLVDYVLKEPNNNNREILLREAEKWLH